MVIDSYAKWYCDSLIDQSLEWPTLPCALEVMRNRNVLRSMKVLTLEILVIRYSLSYFIVPPLCQGVRHDGIIWNHLPPVGSVRQIRQAELTSLPDLYTPYSWFVCLFFKTDGVHPGRQAKQKYLLSLLLVSSNLQCEMYLRTKWNAVVSVFLVNFQQ